MQPLIISLGNRYRCDDAVGPRVLDLLKPVVEGEAELLENRGDIAALLSIWSGREQVILIDAGYSTRVAPGHIYRLDGLTEPLPTDHPVASSHALNISNAIELGKLLDSLPQALCIYTVVGQNFSYGEEMSPAVVSAAQQVAATICADLNIHQSTQSALFRGHTQCMNNR